MPSPAAAFEVVRRLGLRPALHYALYQTKLRSGWFRLRTPGGRWSTSPSIKWRPAQPERFSMPCDSGLRQALSGFDDTVRRQAIAAAENILQGRFEVFGRQVVDVGFPPNWGAFVPLVDDPPAPIPSQAHWSSFDLDASPGDIKLVWELSRFAWAYALGRAYVFSGEERFAAGFWALLASWRQANPPNLGPQWISGQEVALRLMALLYAWRAFHPWLSGDEARAAQMLETIERHARRLPPTLDYALAQDNNHLLVEAAALYATGLALAELPLADAWRAKGRRLLEAAVARQFFADGGYVQHSANYTRLALEAVLWAAVAAERAGDPLPPQVTTALQAGANWLDALRLGGQGELPNFGPNDGALMLPLSACDFDDFRPTLDAVRRMAGGRPLGAGAWNELGDWLGLARTPPEDRATEPSPSQRTFPQAGTYLLGRGRLQLMLRCAHFDQRPGHADQLHADVWYAGRNLALDPGTYLYGGLPPWDNGLAGSDVHNQPSIDRQPIMKRAGPFLWLDWAQGAVITRASSAGGGVELLMATHDGYRALGLSLQRTLVRLGEGALLVIDEAFGQGRHRLEVGWNLPDAGWTVEGRAMLLAEAEWTCRLDLPDAPAALAVFKAGEQIVGPAQAHQPTWGWASPSYALRQACLRTLSSVEGSLPLRLITWFEWDTGTRGRAELAWRPPQAGQAPLSRVGLGAEALDL